MSEQDIIELYSTDSFFPRNINAGEMDALRAMTGTEGWVVLQRMLDEKKNQQVQIGMMLRTDDSVREQARAMHHGIKFFSSLSENLDEAHGQGFIEPEED